MTDHRRAVAERNAVAILDATERLMERRRPLSMAAIAGEAGVSRPTLYAHHPTIADVLEAAVARATTATREAFERSEPATGAPAEALERLVAASWSHLGGLGALVHVAAEHLPVDRVRRAHEPLEAILLDLVARGQREGAFRTDLDRGWLLETYFALVHAADGHVRNHGADRERVLAQLTVTVRDLFAAR